MSTINFPFGAPDNQVGLDVAAETHTISNNFTVIKYAAGLSQGLTLSLSATSGLHDGALIIVEVVQKATKQDVAFGSAGTNTIAGTTVTGVNSKVQSILMRYEDSASAPSIGGGTFRAIQA